MGLGTCLSLPAGTQKLSCAVYVQDNPTIQWGNAITLPIDSGFKKGVGWKTTQDISNFKYVYSYQRPSVGNSLIYAGPASGIGVAPFHQWLVQVEYELDYWASYWISSNVECYLNEPFLSRIKHVYFYVKQ